MNPMTDFDPNIKIRMLTSGDRTSLAALPERVTLASSYARFHGGLSALSERTLDALLDLEVGRREAVIAEDGKGIVGVARYARNASEPATAEIAVLSPMNTNTRESAERWWPVSRGSQSTLASASSTPMFCPTTNRHGS